MTTAIRVKGVSKEYRLGELRGYKTLRESLTGAFSLGSSRNDTGGVTNSPDSDKIWALKDVSFDVEAGEVLGIIGHNGAGKTTLLKILSRIIDPTGGEIELFGRVSSLLEVGTGFHPELTGRENIFLNGSILGMRRLEISSKFDEIVDFSGVERFLDTPVKRYSSGMKVRLAFAVAAHLEPEILLVDEVLAVGDAEFQRKCLGKMGDIAGGGRTIVFVSHNMAAVQNLCQRAMLLDNGTISYLGSTPETISYYLKKLGGEALEFHPEDGPDSSSHRIVRISLCDESGEPLRKVTVATTPCIEIECKVVQPRSDLKLAFALFDSNQFPIFASCPPDAKQANPTCAGSHIYRARLPGPILRAQTYSITVSLYTNTPEDSHTCPHAIRFDVADVASPLVLGDSSRVGAINLLCEWDHNKSSI